MKHRVETKQVVKEIITSYLDWIANEYNCLETEEIQLIFDISYRSVLKLQYGDILRIYIAIADKYAIKLREQLAKYKVSDDIALYELCKTYLELACKEVESKCQSWRQD